MPGSNKTDPNLASSPLPCPSTGVAVSPAHGRSAAADIGAISAAGSPGRSTGVVASAHAAVTLGDAAAQDGALRSFIASIQTTPRPLLAAPPVVAPAVAAGVSPGRPCLPLRSRRIASQRLAGVPVSKRGEILLMQKFGIIKDGAPVTAEARVQYDSLFRSELKPEHISAICELFPDSGLGVSVRDVVDARSEDGAPALEDAA